MEWQCPKWYDRPRVWNKFVSFRSIANQQNEFELIFEDDVKINRHLPNVLKLLPSSLFEQNDLVFFGYG